MIVLDTSVAYALLDRRDELHERAVAWYAAVTEELVTTRENAPEQALRLLDMLF